MAQKRAVPGASHRALRTKSQVEAVMVRIPAHRDHPFRLIVTADSGGT
jgi:hypothetical protein